MERTFAVSLVVLFIALAGAAGGRAQSADAELTLERAVEIYLDRSLEIEAARFEVERIRAGRIAARLRPNPDLTITAENFRLAGDLPFGNLYELGVAYSETIELGGKRAWRSAVADLRVSVAEARLTDTLRRGVAEVERLFHAAVLATGQVEIAAGNRDAFEDLVRYNQARFSEGVISEADLVRVRLERAQFDRTLRGAELVRDQAVIALVGRLGDGEYRGRRIAGALGFEPAVYDVDVLRETALEERPDVRAAVLEIALAGDRLRLEQAESVPDLHPFVGYKRLGASDTVSFGVSIPLPFRDRNQAGVAEAAVEERAARSRLDAIRNRTVAEVESAYRAWEASRDQVLTFREQLIERADRSYSIASIAYREGATELLPLLDAQRVRASVEAQFLQALFDYRNSVLDLELAVGTDLE